MSWRVIVIVNLQTNTVNFLSSYFRPPIELFDIVARFGNSDAFCLYSFMILTINPRGRYYSGVSRWSEQFWADPARLEMVAVYCEPSQFRIRFH